MHQNECPFCNPNERILKENQTARVFLSNPRKVSGHFLVVPKRHIEKPWELTGEELTDIFDLIFFIEKKLVNKLGQGADIRENYRPYAKSDPLKREHVLFHLYPRYQDDYLFKVSEQYEDDLFTELDPGEADEFARLLNDEEN